LIASRFDGEGGDGQRINGQSLHFLLAAGSSFRQAALTVHGFEPLIDRSEIYAFEDSWQRIKALISSADTVVFVLSPDSVASEVCATEVAYAASLNKRFAPVVCRSIEGRLVPEALRRLNFIFFTEPAEFEASVQRLAEALQTDIEWIGIRNSANSLCAGKPPGGLGPPA
jgi:TIR domain